MLLTKSSARMKYATREDVSKVYTKNEKERNKSWEKEVRRYTKLFYQLGKLGTTHFVVNLAVTTIEKQKFMIAYFAKLGYVIANHVQDVSFTIYWGEAQIKNPVWKLGSTSADSYVAAPTVSQQIIEASAPPPEVQQTSSTNIHQQAEEQYAQDNSAAMRQSRAYSMFNGDGAKPLPIPPPAYVP